jgi:signal transduction histidine kinase
MTLKVRLGVGLVAIAVVLVAPFVVALRALQGLQLETASLREREYEATLLLGRMRSLHDELKLNTEWLTLLPSDTTRLLFLERLQTLSRQTDTLQRMTGSVSVLRLRSSAARLAEQGTVAFELSRRGRSRGADSIGDLVLRPALDDIARVLQNAQTGLEERTSERVEEFARRTAEATWVGLAALGIALLLATVIAIWLSRSISGPLRELGAGMQAVAEGRFGRPLAIAADRPDEFGRLADNYRAMALQLQELGRLKAEFVSVASHELKTPVNVLLGYLQLLQENTYGDLTPKQREICETLTSQTQLLSRLIRQLLDVSRFDAGGGKLDLRPLVLQDFLLDLERAFRVLALQREVNFDVRVDNDIPHEVLWDSERVNEVLGNLLSNAFKFTARGGRVALHVGREGDQVRMVVRDTGAGIPPEQLPHIFEKFYQADTVTPLGLRGAGLGLAIARSIVTAHGGQIVADSEVGVGTTFTIRMPSRVTRAPLPPPAVAEAAA